MAEGAERLGEEQRERVNESCASSTCGGRVPDEQDRYTFFTFMKLHGKDRRKKTQ